MLRQDNLVIDCLAQPRNAEVTAQPRLQSSAFSILNINDTSIQNVEAFISQNANTIKSLELRGTLSDANLKLLAAAMARCTKLCRVYIYISGLLREIIRMCSRRQFEEVAVHIVSPADRLTVCSLHACRLEIDDITDVFCELSPSRITSSYLAKMLRFLSFDPGTMALENARTLLVCLPVLVGIEVWGTRAADFLALLADAGRSFDIVSAPFLGATPVAARAVAAVATREVVIGPGLCARELLELLPHFLRIGFQRVSLCIGRSRVADLRALGMLLKTLCVREAQLAFDCVSCAEIAVLVRGFARCTGLRRIDLGEIRTAAALPCSSGYECADFATLLAALEEVIPTSSIEDVRFLHLARWNGLTITPRAAEKTAACAALACSALLDTTLKWNLTVRVADTNLERSSWSPR
eukprot:gnl/Chilomastix_cuspidata/7809.p1 GENE.gnl/Chilomastix_cuspidata/7809~~gnl/Chilomastix_cuspidata/7809.p1  ORF type:complete len:411 (-),score=153.96 gnl/Chilomastix_cuspidata/7809:247-1479(-)